MTDRLDIIADRLLRRVRAQAEYGYGLRVRNLDRFDRAALATLVTLGLVETREENFEIQAFAVSK